MRLRRFELVIISVTLAFACFMGGYFIGRSAGSVSISPTVRSPSETQPTVPQVHMTNILPPTAPVQEMTTTESVTYPQAEQPPAVMPEQATPSATVSSRDAQGRININTASRSELMDLPGIGSSLSERIVDYRNANGPFRSIEEIRNVSGIGERRFEAIMDKITVG